MAERDREVRDEGRSPSLPLRVRQQVDVQVRGMRPLVRPDPGGAAVGRGHEIRLVLIAGCGVRGPPRRPPLVAEPCLERIGVVRRDDVAVRAPAIVLDHEREIRVALEVRQQVQLGPEQVVVQQAGGV